VNPTSTAAHPDNKQLIKRFLERGRRSAAAIPTADRTGPLALSPGQLRFWLLDQAEPASTEYLVPMALRLRGPLDQPALQAALDQVVARHEVLRTRYPAPAGTPSQVIDPPGPVPLVAFDIDSYGDRRERRVRLILDVGDGRSCDERARDLAEQTLRQLMTDVGERPFDLAAEWPLRAYLIRMSDQEHVLLLVAHHIAVDGISMDILADELAGGYQGLVPPGPTFQYADAAAWQHSWLTSTHAERQLAFWRDRLAGLVPLGLPTDKPRPPRWEPAGDVVTFEVPAVDAETVLNEGARQSATPFMTLLAAFWAVLGRLCGGTDIAVGTPAAGRGRVEFERAVGLFVNTVVLRGDLSAAPTFAELIEQARRAVTTAHDHQDLPFQRIVEELGPDRDPSVHPLFQAMFTYREEDPSPRTAGPLTMTEELVSWSPARMDVALDVTRRPDGSLCGAIVYPTALFTRATVERMAGYLATFLHQAGRSPHTPAGRIGFMSAAERHRVLVDWNATAIGRPAYCLPGRFAEHAVVRPDAVALSCSAGELTYRELDAASNRLAHALRDRGVGPETRVAVCLERSPELVVALLAVVKAGGAYVPVDPEYPKERIGYLATDSAPHAVLTTTARAHLFGDGCVCVDTFDTTGFPATPPDSGAGPDHAAYVIYTSGSTGRPKGVVVSHRAITNRLDWMQRAYQLTPSDVVLQKTPFGFDVSVWEFFWPLAAGARLVLARPGGHRDGNYLRDLIDEAGITVCHFVPSMLRSFLDVPGIESCRSLRAVICSGEALPRDVADRFAERLYAGLHNLYGPTEAAVDVTAWQCRPGWQEARIPIGAPIDNICLYVLDEAMEPVPVGVPGELYIGGVGVARGYLNRPALTAERFVPNPFTPGRLYQTGDIVRWRDDGTVDYLGRRDHQVKIRGHRIETSEIEAVLGEHPDVRAAAVTVDQAADPRLVAYVVADPACEIRALRSWLAERLPGYLVPAFFMRLDSLPVSAHGKLDRSALPAPDAGDIETEFTPARGPAETAVAQAWATALGVPAVGAHGNFFELGGDSIRALRAVGMLREAGWKVDVQDVLRRQTPAALAVIMGAQRGAPEEPTVSAPFAHVTAADSRLLPASLSDAYPLTQMQAGMLFELGSDTELSPYHNVTGYVIKDDGPFSPAALQAAAQALVSRHDVLRTSFDLTSFSVPMQLVHPDARVEITVEDITGLSGEQQRMAGLAALRRERSRPFEITRAPLWRLYIQRLAATRWRLGWVECHPILDGWSHNSLLSELLEAYRAARQGAPIPASPPCGVRFADCVAAERAAIGSAGHEEFWAARTLGYEKLRLPGIWADPGATDPFPYDLQLPIAHLLPGLRALAKAAGAPLKSVLLAAHVKVMSMVTDQQRFRTGLSTNGRPEVAGGDQVPGMFLNIVPFAVPAGAATWRQLVQAVFGEETALWPYRCYPAAEMQRRWGQGSALHDVVFNYLDFHVLDRGKVDLEETEDRSPTNFDLVVSTAPGTLMLSAAPRVIAPEWGRRLAGLYTSVLESMAADPDGDAQADCLPPAERRLALGSGDAGPPPARCVHEMFADQVARTPDAVAVEFGAERLSYAELDARANRLAHYLRGKGVGPDVVVGICLDRSAELVVAILAVLKADGAYLALDAGDPPPRLAGLLADAQARLVLTSAGLLGAIAHADVICLERLSTEDLPSSTPEVRATAEDLAYLIYTSGSTGRPKAVAIPHRGVADLVAGPDYLAFGVGQTLLLHSPVTFDAATYEIWGALLHGGRLVVAPPGLLEPGELCRVIARHGVTAAFITHGLFKLVVDEGLSELTGLHTLMTGGEAVSAEHLERARRALPSTRLVNCYGPTETTTYAVCQPMAPDEPVTGPVPIGQPIAGTVTYVLDARGRAVPAGVPGELCIGGPGLARGYLGRAELTASQFVPDPYGDMPGGRLYRTGDLVRRRPDGLLDFLGRIDNQVKIRGHRIEPGEIEAVLHQHPGVRMAAVVPREITPGERRLVGYVLLAPSGPAPARLREYLAGLLPDYLVPEFLVPLDRFPMTSSGKIDRAALPGPAGLRPQLDAPYVPPTGHVQEVIASTWRAVLGVDRVGIRDDFLQLGGHSLAAMRAAARLRAELGLQVTARDIMRLRTVAKVKAMARPGSQPAGPPAGAMVWFRASGDLPPLFAVHPGGGSVHWYRGLADRLPGRPFAALQHPALMDDSTAGLPVAELAGRYLTEIRRAQPTGPYTMFGWCGGTAVTWELAARLRASGERVHLFLLDPCLPAREPPQHLRLLQRGEELLAALAAGRADEALRAELLAVLRDVVDDDGGEPLTEDQLGDDWHPRLRLWRGIAEAAQGYRFGAADLPVRIVLTDDLMGDGHDAKGGLTHEAYVREWRRLGREVSFGGIGCGHLAAMAPPGVDELAGLLLSWLADTGARDER
jgi:amino acid adenylation domain-containing protein